VRENKSEKQSVWFLRVISQRNDGVIGFPVGSQKSDSFFMPMEEKPLIGKFEPESENDWRELFANLIAWQCELEKDIEEREMNKFRLMLDGRDWLNRMIQQAELENRPLQLFEPPSGLTWGTANLDKQLSPI